MIEYRTVRLDLTARLLEVCCGAQRCARLAAARVGPSPSIESLCLHVQMHGVLHMCASHGVSEGPRLEMACCLCWSVNGESITHNREFP